MNPRPVKPTCAICAAEIAGAPRLEPLGKHDAMVAVCDACATEHPRERHGPERAYEGSGPMFAAGEIHRALRRKQGDVAYEQENKRIHDYGRSPSVPTPRAQVDLDAVRREGQRRRRTGAAEKARSKGRIP